MGWLSNRLPAAVAVWLINEVPAVGSCRGVARKRVRHEALLFRTEVRDLCLLVVAAAG